MERATAPLTIEILGAPLSVCRLSADAALPAWALSGSAFSSVTRTAHELSVICATTQVAAGASGVTAREDGWRALHLVGPFAFSEVGVLLRVAAPLAEAGIGILPVATFDTDYVLVAERNLTAAIAALRASGHTVLQPGERPAESRRTID